MSYLSVLALCRSLADQFEAADRLLVTVLERATQTGAVGLMPFALAGRAFVKYRRGSWDVAQASALEAVQLARDTDRSNDLAIALTVAALAEQDEGKPMSADGTLPMPRHGPRPLAPRRLKRMLTRWPGCLSWGWGILNLRCPRWSAPGSFAPSWDCWNSRIGSGRQNFARHISA